MIGIRGAAVSAMGAIFAIASIACLALIVLTTLQHRHSEVLLDAVSSVRLAQEAEVDLLSRERAQEHVRRSSLEAELTRTLQNADAYVTSRAEREALDQAVASVEQYLVVVAAGDADTPERRAALDQAFVALEELVEVNLEGARDAELRTARLDGMANVIAGAAGAVLVGVLMAIVAALERAIVGPALALSRALQEFRAGNPDARVVPFGVRELREIGERFNEMAAALAERDRSRITLVAGVVHDLRDPLAAIHLATPDPARPLPPEDRLRAAFGVLRRQVGRLQRMIADLLDAARIEGGNLPLQLEHTDVRAVVRHAVDALEGGAGDHAVVLDVPTDPVPLRIDPHRIEQAVTNLLTNAIKYSPSGGEVRVSVRSDDGWTVLEVADQGIGIAPGELESVWEPFRRGGPATDHIRGVGLGLYVTKSVVEAHGGEIRVRSTIGAGSTFTIRLPKHATSRRR